MDSDGSGLREVLALGDSSALRGDWIDADRIAFVSEDGPCDRLGILTLTDGSVRWIAAEPEVLAFDIVAASAGRFATVVHDRPWTRALVWDGAKFRPLPNLSGRRSLLPQAALPGGGWLAEAYDADAPHDLVVVAADGACRSLLRRSETASARRHVRPRDFRWTAPDGETVQGWLYLPEGRPRGLIAYVHGGPTWHSEDWVNPKTGFWVQSGYAVLDPNYRGSTGFGRRWREMVKEDGWGGREQIDIRSGIEAVLAAGVPGPVAVAGNSYGGFSSWWQIARSPDLVAAAIPMCGMWRLDIDYAETGMPWGQSYSEEMMGGSPSEFPEKYENASPGSFVRCIRGSVLVVHGLADTNVGPENTHAAIRDMQAAGIRHRALLFADEGHGVFRRSNVETYLDATAGFLAEALGAAEVR
jgi:dipeptidyl aminopeptidase/acylaminoacyl peptidase